MIKGYFSSGEQVIEVSINGEGLQFKDVTNNALIYPNFTYIKVIQEFPDLKDREDWQVEAGKRFVKFFHEQGGEKKKLFYIKDELTKQGYKPMYWQKQGFRTQMFKELGEA